MPSSHSKSVRSGHRPRLLLASLVAGAIGFGGCRPAEPTASPSAAETPPTSPQVDHSGQRPPQRAEVGVGRQGQSLEDVGGVGGAIAQPARTLFTVRERMTFEVQIPQAMQLFEATEGRKPQSHDEFMQRIVQANQIQLPELPAGSEYRYEPDKGELWVHPAE